MATPTLYDMISIKLQLGDETRRLKLPLKDLTPNSLPSKLCGFLNIPASKKVVFERYSDSAGAYITLDSNNHAVYKQLYRAAKAKSKLRIKVNVSDAVEEKKTIPIEHIPEEKVIPTIKSTQAPSARSSQTAFSIPIQTPRKVEIIEPVRTETKPTIPSPLKSWTGHLTSFTVQCNNCGDTIPDVHYHCDICDNNDFDLCGRCVDSGAHCDVDDHYLIKRSVVDGKISNSTTYKIAKKITSEKMPGAFQPEVGAFQPEIKRPVEATRTCNSCITSYDESHFITCMDCEDYDLCGDCFTGDKHGHHPVHRFQAVNENSAASVEVTRRLTTGRGLRHYATCDGCDSNINGIRHKCLNCPDWDFCSTCVLSARQIHPGHRFAAIYDHIELRDSRQPIHNFIRCDGPLCMNKDQFIRGDRYKCAVCPDTDFCSNCEAHPSNGHNRTHPVIKIRSPIRNVSVTTFGEDGKGQIMSTMGDQAPQQSSKSTETLVSKSANAATQVQTIAEIKPAAPKAEEVVAPTKEEKIDTPAQTSVKEQLQAHYVSDTLVDGTKVIPGELYTQTWTLLNPGPLAWPAGCAIRFTGGDNMLNINTDQPASTKDIEAAVSSNTCALGAVAGAAFQFSVTIRAPLKEGRAISYWRLKTAQGVPFGHKLWCDVHVQAKTVEPIVKKEEADVLATSQMVFPTLEKESPASSMMAAEAPKAPSVTDNEVEFVDDLEQLSLSDDDSEDAFLTDEEYEMLDTDSAIEEAINGKK